MSVKIPIKVPVAVMPETVGDFSLIQLITTFSTPHSQSPQPFALHPHLTTNGPYTHPIIVLVNALLTQKRIVFLGRDRASGEVANHVLAACYLASGGVLKGFTRHAFPYTDISKVDELLFVSGFIAGVKNPMFEEMPAWWDVLCDIDAGRIKISPQLKPPPLTDGLSFFNLNPNVGVSDYVKFDTMDGAFMDDVMHCIHSRFGEWAVRARWRDWVIRFTRVATAFEESVYGASALWIGHEENHVIRGHGYVWADDALKVRELTANAARIEGWRGTRSYLTLVQESARLYQAKPIKIVDLHHQIDRLRVLRLSHEESEKIYMVLKHYVDDYEEINQLLCVIPETQNGIFPIAFGLFHPNQKVRFAVVELLEKISTHLAGRHFFNNMNRFQKLAFIRLRQERENNAAGGVDSIGHLSSGAVPTTPGAMVVGGTGPATARHTTYGPPVARTGARAKRRIECMFGVGTSAFLILSVRCRIQSEMYPENSCLFSGKSACTTTKHPVSINSLSHGQQVNSLSSASSSATNSLLASKSVTLSAFPCSTSTGFFRSNFFTNSAVSSRAPRSSIPASPASVPVSWHSSSSAKALHTAGSRETLFASSLLSIWKFGMTFDASLPTITTIGLGFSAGARRRNGEKATKPASLERRAPAYAYVSVRAPPAEWPMRKSGGCVAWDSQCVSRALRISSRSEKMAAVPPVTPHCFLSSEDLPQPLCGSRCPGQLRVFWGSRGSDVPLVERIGVDAAAGEVREEVVVGPAVVGEAVQEDDRGDGSVRCLDRLAAAQATNLPLFREQLVAVLERDFGLFGSDSGHLASTGAESRVEESKGRDERRACDKSGQFGDPASIVNVTSPPGGVDVAEERGARPATVSCQSPEPGLGLHRPRGREHDVLSDDRLDFQLLLQLGGLLAAQQQVHFVARNQLSLDLDQRPRRDAWTGRLLLLLRDATPRVLLDAGCQPCPTLPGRARTSASCGCDVGRCDVLPNEETSKLHVLPLAAVAIRAHDPPLAGRNLLVDPILQLREHKVGHIPPPDGRDDEPLVLQLLIAAHFEEINGGVVCADVFGRARCDFAGVARADADGEDPWVFGVRVDSYLQLLQEEAGHRAAVPGVLSDEPTVGIAHEGELVRRHLGRVRRALLLVLLEAPRPLLLVHDRGDGQVIRQVDRAESEVVVVEELLEARVDGLAVRVRHGILACRVLAGRFRGICATQDVRCTTRQARRLKIAADVSTGFSSIQNSTSSITISPPRLSTKQQTAATMSRSLRPLLRQSQSLCASCRRTIVPAPACPAAATSRRRSIYTSRTSAGDVTFSEIDFTSPRKHKPIVERFKSSLRVTASGAVIERVEQRGVGEDILPDEIPAGPEMPLSEQLKLQMRRVLYPIVLVTAYEDAENPETWNAMTISSFNTVSMDPIPLISFNVKFPSTTGEIIMNRELFVVNVLCQHINSAKISALFVKPPPRPTTPDDMAAREATDGLRVMKENSIGRMPNPSMEPKFRPTKGPFEGIPVYRTPYGIRLIPNVLLASMGCQLRKVVSAGDHRIIIAEVMDLYGAIGDRPHERRRFHLQGARLEREMAQTYRNGKYVRHRTENVFDVSKVHAGPAGQKVLMDDPYLDYKFMKKRRSDDISDI
ncbi:LOW QUALITY PROTEIN: hypothetical protein Dda_3577 [Drechslerella dactyloides]|uniref:UDENN domain-containing protein n=1 Tax=Drechslerella dactyloides TaxID=74499 RepID=A0AAD6IYN9_DREDA|nr:LOW QUALITY PROTEIN: hypothetical protein Dda_3577 [Drechslerella dactyloides]